jgi:acetyl-CoA acetyltransferase
MKDIGIPSDITEGGAIVMGHPLGTTRAILAGTLLDELDAATCGATSSPCASAAAWASPPSSRGSDEVTEQKAVR